MEELLAMTVGRVYLMFDDFAAYVALTNPWGGGDEEDSESPQTPRPTTKETQNVSAFEFGSKAAQAGLFSAGVPVKTLDQAKSEDPLLSEWIEEAMQEN